MTFLFHRLSLFYFFSFSSRKLFCRHTNQNRLSDKISVKIYAYVQDLLGKTIKYYINLISIIYLEVITQITKQCY